MKIKAVIFDIDCTISKTDMLEFIAKSIGKEREATYWEDAYYSGMKNARTSEEKEIAAEYGARGKFSLIQGMKVSELKEVCSKIEIVDGTNKTLDDLSGMGLKIIGISSTFFPIASMIMETHNIRMDDLITSKCEATDVLGKVTFVLTPKRKSEVFLKILEKYGIRPEECVAVGDSVSEVPIFEIIGRERSIGFNCRESLKPFVGHVASEYGDEKRNMLSVRDIIKDIMQAQT